MQKTYDGYTFAELVQGFLKADKPIADLYIQVLTKLQQRRDAERDLITKVRRKRPGLADHEILQQWDKWLNKHYPLP